MVLVLKNFLPLLYEFKSPFARVDSRVLNQGF